MSLISQDNEQLLEKFILGSTDNLTSEDFRIQVENNVSFLMGVKDSMVYARLYIGKFPVQVILKKASLFHGLISRFLESRRFIKSDIEGSGIETYKLYEIEGYNIYNETPQDFWKKWWPLSQDLKQKCAIEVNEVLYKIIGVETGESAHTFLLKDYKQNNFVAPKIKKFLWAIPVISEDINNRVSDRLRSSGSLSNSGSISSNTVPKRTPDRASPSIDVLEAKIDRFVTKLASLESRISAIESTLAELSDYLNRFYTQSTSIDRDTDSRLDLLSSNLSTLKGEHKSILEEIYLKEQNRFRNLFDHVLDGSYISDDETHLEI